MIINVKCKDICRGWSRPSPTLLIRLVVIIVGIFVNLHAENPDSTLLKLENQKTNIEYVSDIFDINPDFL
ncbi:MAG: hypothetical protein DRP93_05955, partial [Candidatus Neomarinimicrobiota bacterium]